MSCIVDFAETSISTANVVAGFDIMGPDSPESITQDSNSNDTIADGTMQDLMGNSSRFDFMNSEPIEEGNEFGAENEAIVDEIDGEPAEDSNGGDIVSDISGKDIFALEFFNDDFDIDCKFTAGENEIAVKGSSDNNDSENQEISFKLSINGQEFAEFDVDLNFHDDNYDMF